MQSLPCETQRSNAVSQTEASLLLVVLYAGRLPNYFELFLRSAARNTSVRWALLCDQRPAAELPANVAWVPFSITDLENRARARLGIRTRIEHPYKLCDFKPTVGMLYPEVVEGFDYWGHCDPDIIWGDIRSFTKLDKSSPLLKLQGSGAYSIYRNTDAGNSLFMLPHPWISYRKVLSSPKNFSFDEWPGLWRVLEHHDVPRSNEMYMAEMLVGSRDLRLQWGKNYREQVFFWQNGRLLRRFWGDCEGMDEFAYAHLQKRAFAPPQEPSDFADFAIVPGRFVPLVNGTDVRALARENCRSLVSNAMFALSRPARYLRSLRRFDRSLIRRHTKA